VVFKPSYGLGISWGATTFSNQVSNQVANQLAKKEAIEVADQDSSQGPWVKMAWAEKPINTLAIAYDYNLFLSTNNVSPEAGIEIKPVSYRSQIYQAEVGWQGQGFGSYAGILQENPMIAEPDSRFSPKPAGAPQEWIFQKFQPLTVWGAGFSGNLSLSTDWALQYLRVKQSRTQDFNQQNQFRGETSPYRLHFEEAFRLHLVHHHSFFNIPVTTSVQYTRDMLADGHLLKFLQSWKLRSSLQVYGGVDIIGVTDLDNKDGDQFFNRYRSNDRVYGGVEYVF
jgi:hypothetical protein